MIKTETQLEQLIVADQELIAGMLWGKPRNGHPEGQVLIHINHVLANIDLLSDQTHREKLRLIAIIHDSFKYKVDLNKPKSGENHHAMIARRFAEKYINDTEVLEIIELHDEAYNSWCKGSRNNNWQAAETRGKNLVKRLGDSLGLYLVFYQCDNETGNKQGIDFIWFKKLITS